jgi:hypothetical protein
MTNRVALFNLAASAQKIRRAIGVHDLTSRVKVYLSAAGMTGGRLLEPAHNDAITPCPTTGYNYFAVHGVIVGFRPNTKNTPANPAFPWKFFSPHH